MFRLLFLFLICYSLFILGGILFPLFVVIGFILLAFYGIKALFDLFTPRWPLNRRNHVRLFYTGRNPVMWVLVAIWQGVMTLIYHVIFTISKAIHDGKNSSRS